MGYKALIGRSVAKAFTAVKDLAVDLTLLRTVTTGFNFSTALPTSTTPSSVLAKGVILSVDKKSEVHNSLEKELFLQTLANIDLTTYDQIQIGADTWKIGPVIHSDGFTTLLKIFREV